MKIEKEKLKSFLLDLDLVSEEQFEKAERKAIRKNRKIEDMLVIEDILDEKKLVGVKAHILGIPFIDLEKIKVPLDVLKIIPEHFARANSVVPFRKQGDDLEISMTNPEDLKVVEVIKKATGLNILPRLATTEGIKNVLGQYQESLEEEISEVVDDEEKIRSIKEDDTEYDLEKSAEEMPVIKIVDILIKHAILQRASDIHIEPQEKEILIRYRIDGILRDAMTLPINIASGIVARIKVLSNLKLDEHRLPQDGRFKVENKDYRYSLRVSVLPVSYGEKIVMRLLPEMMDAMDLEEIGLRSEALEAVKEALKKTSGMILVTGPTGSGKTTTLYSLLKTLNTPGVNISTVEDPIEYQIGRINQTQVSPKIGLTFASGLRSLVRQDPDVLMVGEIRDDETARLATNAALTGHLVLSTLHTTNSAGAVSRLMDMEIEPFLISSTLSVVIAQRLLRKLDSKREGYFLTDAEVEDLAKYCDIGRITALLQENNIIKEDQSIKDVEFFHPSETKDAPDGYKGRVGVCEALPVTEEIRELIINRSGTNKIEEKAKSSGMVTMLEDGIVKAAQGTTTIEEVLRVLIE